MAAEMQDADSLLITFSMHFQGAGKVVCRHLKQILNFDAGLVPLLETIEIAKLKCLRQFKSHS